MSLIEELKQIKNLIPECVRNCFGYVKSPVNFTKDNSLKDFVATALLVGVILALFKAALPTAFLFDGVAGINPLVLSIILLTNGLSFSIILLVIGSVPTWIKGDRVFQWSLFYQSIRTFSVFNLILPIFLVIGINREFVAGDFSKAISFNDLSIGGFLAVITFWIFIRTLIKPAKIFFDSYYKPKLALISSIVIVMLASYLNPALKLPMFENLVDNGKLCEAMIEKNFKSQIISGKADFYQKLYECKENI